MSLVFLVFLPLFSSFICGVFNNFLSRQFVGVFSSLAVVLSSFISIKLFYQSMFVEYFGYVKLFNWLDINIMTVDWEIYADNLTVVMYAVICIISSVVHIYSIGYMKDDARFNIFMSYISLFTFFMLIMVSAGNLLQMFFGWEGVGFCSYLLIGFWYEKQEACIAAQKAFLVNRFADLAIIIGMVIIYNTYFSLDYNALKNYDVALLCSDDSFIPGWNLLDLTCLLFFIGCMGKSAQIGLHVWLPDAMEGPTPVSALIHAATMVTAGVFLIARLNFLFQQSTIVNNIIIIIGSITCVFASIVAIGQTDMKKIIAYSTSSQLGYMFIACGCKAYHAAIFHLTTHAFYKAALFLAAGNVIHATNQQDINMIGNVRAAMKTSFMIFLIASIAIVGIAPLSGFYSKDLILGYAFNTSALAFWFGILAAFCTGLYSTRIIKKLFFVQNVNQHAHEADVYMLIAFYPLILGSLTLGYFGVHILLINQQSGYFNKLFNIELIKDTSLIIHYMPSIAAIVGIIFGCYNLNKIVPVSISKLVKNKFYFDQVYQKLIVLPMQGIALFVALFDTYIIDKLGPGNLVNITKAISVRISKYHTGYIFDYAAWIFCIVLCITILISI